MHFTLSQTEEKWIKCTSREKDQMIIDVIIIIINNNNNNNNNKITIITIIIINELLEKWWGGGGGGGEFSACTNFFFFAHCLSSNREVSVPRGLTVQLIETYQCAIFLYAPCSFR